MSTRGLSAPPEKLSPNTSGLLTLRVTEGEEEAYPLLKPVEHPVKKVNIFRRCYRSYFADKDESYVDTLLASNTLVRALRFFPALFITFAIELGNTVVLGDNQEVLSKHFTLILFIPVISAIAGNIGLQTSSSVTSYLNLRQLDKKPLKVRWLLSKYVSHCFLQMLVLSSCMGGLAMMWKSSDICKHAHGVIVLFGSMVNMLIASVAGVATPILLNNFGYDPSSGAGPFETALQDVVGAVFFVYFARWVLDIGIYGCYV